MVSRHYGFDDFGLWIYIYMHTSPFQQRTLINMDKGSLHEELVSKEVIVIEEASGHDGPGGAAGVGEGDGGVVEVAAPQGGPAPSPAAVSTDQSSPTRPPQPQSTGGNTARLADDTLNMADPCESCSDCAAFEFQPENVAPFHSNRWLFLKSQWEVPWGLYVVYRIGIAVMFTIWVIADFVDEASNFYSDNYAIWLIFATNWSFLLLGMSAVLNAIVCTVYFIKDKRRTQTLNDEQGAKSNQGYDERCIPVPLMMLWVIFNTAANGAIVVTISYWGFLVSVDRAGFLVTTMSRLKHTLNTLYVIFELSFNAMPVRVFHVVYPLFLGAIYTVFNAMYFINNGVGPGGQPYAYYVMDWRNPLESALTCSMGFVTTTIVQGLMYGFYRLRTLIYAKVMGSHYSALANDSELEVGSDSEMEGILTCRSRTSSYSSTEHIELDGVE